MTIDTQSILNLKFQIEGGWGPVNNETPESFSSIPYAPYSKLDRLNKIADWTNTNTNDSNYDRSTTTTTGGRGRRHYRGSTHDDRSSRSMGLNSSVFNYQAMAEDDNGGSFSFVGASGSTTTTASTRRSYARPPGRPKNAFRSSSTYRQQQSAMGSLTSSLNGPSGSSGNQSTIGSNAPSSSSRPMGKFYGNLRKRYYANNDNSERLRDASVKIGEDWTVLEEVDFGRLSKLTFELPEDPVDLDQEPLGELRYYDKSFERVTTRMEKFLQKTDKTLINPTTERDTHLINLAKKSDDHVIVATDSIVSAIMCATKSVYPWDIQVTKEGKYVYLNKRDGGVLDRLNNHENAVDPPSDAGEKESNNNPNTQTSLSQEATSIQRHLLLQVLKDNEPLEFHHSPSFESSSTAPLAFKYREWSLGQDKKGNPLKLIARTQVHAAIHQPGMSSTSSHTLKCASSSNPISETLLANMYALNEYEPKAGGAPEWRPKLDAQRGAIIASEIKNNSNKLSRWAVESILSGVDQMKLGFISRVSFRDRSRHTILGISSYKPKEFASQMNLNLSNGWGIFKAFADVFMDLDDGKYALVKDPNRGILRIYRLP